MVSSRGPSLTHTLTLKRALTSTPASTTHTHKHTPQHSHTHVYTHTSQHTPTQAEDPDLPAFYFDPLITPISAHYTEKEREAEEASWQEEDEDAFSFASGLGAGFVLPPSARPILEDRPLYTDSTAAGIILYWAPRPFNLRQVGRWVGVE